MGAQLANNSYDKAMIEGPVNMPRTGLNFPAPDISPFTAAIAITLLAAAFAAGLFLQANGVTAQRKRLMVLVATALSGGSWFLAALQPHRPLPGPGFATMCAILTFAVLGCALAGGHLARSRGRRPLLSGAACFGACVLGFALGLLMAGWIYQMASDAGAHAPPAETTTAVACLPFACMVAAGTLTLIFLGRHRRSFP